MSEIVVTIVSIHPFVRLYWPSQYVPARHSSDTFLGHPCFARLLATFAEPIFYWAEAACLGVPFWSGSMGVVTLIGESISWVHLLCQSELIGVIEDSTWMFLQLVAVLTCAYL